MMPLQFLPPAQTDSSPKTLSTTFVSNKAVLQPFRGKTYTFWFVFLLCMLAAVYWGIIASDRYVSESHIVIQQTQMPATQTMNLSSILGGTSAPNRTDQMLLRDFLLSIDMLEKLDKKLSLREHYSDRRRDPISRMWYKDLSTEWFYWYYLLRTTVEFDEYAGVLVIRAQAFTPEQAHAITSLLVEEGERYMNDMAHRLAQEQVGFIEKQVEQIYERVMQARMAVVAYQNERNLVSPEGTAEYLVGIVNALEGQLASLNTQRNAALGYLNPKSPTVMDFDLQIAAVKNQISKEQARLTSSNRQMLNVTVEEFQRLKMNAEFAQEVYKSALASLEQVRIDARRTIKMVSIIQSPTSPQYALEPRRIYNTVVFVLVTLVIFGIVSLIRAIVRDHQE
jgi:capsular polysaccharide transport system permease protein